jgi:hypothetical protein
LSITTKMLASTVKFSTYGQKPTRPTPKGAAGQGLQKTAPTPNPAKDQGR